MFVNETAFWQRLRLVGLLWEFVLLLPKTGQPEGENHGVFRPAPDRSPRFAVLLQNAKKLCEDIIKLRDVNVHFYIKRYPNADMVLL